ncbi:hypothetical protein [Salarchaeum sp. JOR-1]|uniref:DUF7835 family putative zinc beta-ribbon protein n=1 Tax=Salarchaeum sp. JOR-1 TaxID=2599399 RepID=UPI00119849E4|nr:hypothetical protein [Salarchaeum sp. JOR-1]QDX39941.1 hypothetical protein FQU85_03150 [Salarchaeum sp. JOR-1]
MSRGPQRHDEPCPVCDATTTHLVTIELRQEGPDGENCAYSREPYRVTECTVCGRSRASRVRSA